MNWLPVRVAPEPDTDVLVVLRDEYRTWVDTAHLGRDGYWYSAGSYVLLLPRVLMWQRYPALPHELADEPVSNPPL